MKDGRIIDSIVNIEKNDIEKFFMNRAERANELHSLAQVSYQDNNYRLAQQRDRQEKEKILPKIIESKNETVLDIGCGIGRWAEALKDEAQEYLGTDITEDFILSARKKYSSYKNIQFSHMDAIQTSLNIKKGHYTKTIIAGLLLYLNDAEVYTFLNNLAKKLKKETKIIIREPLGIDRRLTLKNVWSEELNHNYSAIYREHHSFTNELNKILSPQGFELIEKDTLYSEDLNNRSETKQFYFVFKRD